MRTAHLDWGSRKMTVVAVMSSTADSSFLLLPFSFLVDILNSFFPLQNMGQELKALKFFHYDAVCLFSIPSSYLYCFNCNCIKHSYLNPLYFFTTTTKRVLIKNKTLICCAEFALTNSSFVVAAENQRCILTRLLLLPINLAVVPGSSEDNADLGKQPFFLLLTFEMAAFQKPQLMEYHKV